MKDPIVSIIIATYNSGETLRKALQSVQDQTYQYWECLIVDGASRDNTIEIVKEFASKDTRFRYISEPDKGIYDAFNKGWKNAKGEWIYYLGSDDRLTKEGLNELSKYIDSDVSFLSGDVYIQHIDGRRSLIKAKNGHPDFGYHQGMIMRKSVIAQFNGFDEKYKILADYDLLVRIIKSGGKMQLVDTCPIAFFAQGGTTSQLRTFINTIKDKYDIYKRYKYVRYPFISVCKYAYIKLRSIIYRRLRKYLNI